MNEYLMRAVVESVAFFGLCSEETCSEDVAVTQLEQIAAILKGLKPDEQTRFRAFTLSLAGQEAASHGDPHRIQFLRSLCDHLGFEG